MAVTSVLPILLIAYVVNPLACPEDANMWRLISTGTLWEKNNSTSAVLYQKNEKRDKWSGCEGPHQELLFLCPEHPRLWGSKGNALTHLFSVPY